MARSSGIANGRKALGRHAMSAGFGRKYAGPMIGGILFLAFVSAALFPGLLAPYDPNFLDYTVLQKPPSMAHPFGTDNLGRDMLSRVIWAASVDLQIAVFSTTFPVIFGTTIGCLIGYYGGIFDTLFGRLVDLVVTVPFLVLVIAVVAVLGPGLVNLYIAVGIVGWVAYARLTRSEMVRQKSLDYAAAARVMGFGPLRIIFDQLLPNVIGPVIVYWMTDMSLVILLGSSLGYLGLGAQPPNAEWGVMIADARNLMANAWWMSISPGIAIVLAGMSFSLLGDGVSEWLQRKN
jgi:peptide/nickel transport system permease protein